MNLVYLPPHKIARGWVINQEACSSVLLRLLKLEVENLHQNVEKSEWVIADCYSIENVEKSLRLISVSKF